MGKKVLIIEDDAVLLAQLGDAFKKSGLDVFLARDGDVGIELFEIVRPDLVITDIVMPTKEGISVIMDIKRSAFDTAIVAITGGGARGGRNYLRWAKELGADVAIQKPFRMSIFKMIAEQLLREAEYRRLAACGEAFSMTADAVDLEPIFDDLGMTPEQTYYIA